ncbi:HD superfamily phosphohydrolase [Dysgonomonas sp. PH5-45]|uniref:HD domain-containing protein n=1 Tax=unclassified Dysgonomonas TaxID=2630389 RepID=UPI00247667F7|nr:MULTISPECIES: HD domain-containing protein [unclassified Dysgonomonas]MDH6354766.1 HD superfamily phosphohydrolase [Dysgonomonas sp. PH5-45]MDH6387665.1 HD superfamily phosphohydrolase [Dysgonomonas sp. PH5-37]
MPNNKRKIINDPVFGFITIPNDFLYNLIQHPFLQRLNRIRQLGLASFVYPGAQHTRLLHSIGAMHLMNEAITNLRTKGHAITDDEANGALACILLHDVGHGPFSHVLENTLVTKIRHEEISLMMMQKLNQELDGALDLCIDIFTDRYKKKFLHQLVSGQLDMDRLDYLRRDSFFTGVTEGNIGSARIIKMLDVRNDRLVVESKGIYSVENFLMSRRLMYWQVYLHKTSVAAEKMIVNTLCRAKQLAGQGAELFASPALSYFLKNDVTGKTFCSSPDALLCFSELDDNDIWCSLKIWANHTDKVLSALSNGIINRNLFKIEMSQQPKPKAEQELLLEQYSQRFGVPPEEASYFFSADVISSNMYNEADDSIDILYHDGSIKNISEASDMLNIELLSKKVEKHYFAYFR